MSRKPKFRPKIRWIKLNPEQAVLQCECYTTGFTCESGDDWYPHIWGPVGKGTYCYLPGSPRQMIDRQDQQTSRFFPSTNTAVS
jgi:hypothetical protein